MKFSKSTFINLIVTTSLALTALLCSFVVYGWFSTSWSGSDSKIDFKTGENTVPDGKYFIYLSQDDVDYDTTRYTILVNQYDQLIAEKQGEIDLATEELEKKTTAKNDTTNEYKTLVNDTIPNIEAVISSLEKSITSTTGKIDELREDIDDTTAEKAAKEIELNSKIQEVTLVEDEFNSKTTEKTNKQNLITSNNDLIASLRAQIEALEEGDPEIDNLNEKIENLVTTNDGLYSDVTRLEGEISSLNTNLTTLRKQRDQLQSEFDDLTDELAGYQEDKDEQESTLADLNTELDTNEGFYDEYLANKETLEGEIRELTSRINDLTNNIIPGYVSELSKLKEDQAPYIEKRDEVLAKVANLWNEYEFVQGSLLESKVLLSEVDIVDTSGNTFTEEMTTFDYVLERIQLGTIDNLVSLKPDNHFYVRFYIEPSVHGKNMNVYTSYIDDDVTLIDKNKYVVTDDAILTEINTADVTLLTFKVAISADPYAPGTTDFDNLEFAEFSETIVSEDPYYLYLEITPDLGQFTDLIEKLNAYMDCVLLFKVNIELSSYTSPGTED